MSMSYKTCLTVLSASSHRPATKTLLLLLLLAFSSPSPLWHSSFARPQGSIHSFLPANKANTQMGLLSLTSFASQNCASVSPLCFSSSHSSTLIFPFPTFTLQSSVFVLCVCVCVRVCFCYRLRIFYGINTVWNAPNHFRSPGYVQE